MNPLSLLTIDNDLHDEFVFQFDDADRLAASIIFEDKPKVTISEQPESLNQYRVRDGDMMDGWADEPFYCLTVKEFGRNFLLESGVSLDDAIHFCRHYKFEYEVRK